MASEPVELGRALTGEELPLAATDVAALAAELATVGWDASRLTDLRHQRQVMRQPWPFPVPIEARRDLGFARFDARLADLRALLGLSGQLAATRSVRPWTEAERRLAADRPPHWG
ncbi:hypothetical protein [Tessaracoccus antarcticus]|uniref:Uncharacterized protein n=1 Tax=Tessaracoccus antarcticus TaxID=2479848 RepID=A0A3M0GAT6_9ACTN|nr:hypothetical protein [Tessaracoccus antarcticus]RMB62125.1 hypothetical protein EAX62_06010 [Tessaracoccus antarcticus]